MRSMATGMAVGAGSEVGHQAIRGMMGSGSGSGHGEAPAQQPPAGYAEQPMAAAQEPVENPCAGFNQSFLQCLQANRGEIGVCQNYMDMMNQCERDQSFRTYQ